MHEDGFHIDRAQIRAALGAQAPHLAGLELRPLETGGTQCYLWRLGADLVLRVPRHPGAVPALLREARWLPVLAPHLPLAVPQLVVAGAPCAALAQPWAVYRWIPGADAGRAPLDQAQAARALAGFLRALWAVPVPPDAPQTDRGGPARGRDAGFRAALPGCAGLVDVAGDIALAEAAWQGALAAPPWDQAPRWIHTDLIPANLVVRAGRLAGVLDFGCLSTGDPAYDLTAAWFVLDPPARAWLRAELGIDPATWARARGHVAWQSVLALPYYIETNPVMVALARRGLYALRSD